MQRTFVRGAACLAVLLWIGPAVGEVSRAGLLRTRYLSLQKELAQSPFRRPIHVVSSASDSSASADIHAVLEFPFTTVRDTLSRPTDWCEILNLHLNVKACRVSTRSGQTHLDVAVGRKYDQPLADAYRLDFVFRVVERGPTYLRVRLEADEGPLSTRDHDILVEGVEIARSRTFLHLSYSHGYGTLGRLAMQTYLSTVARNKVGFTVVGKDRSGQPLYVGGMRGAVERNTMRYYLAIESFLGALAAPPPQRFEKSIRDWFEAIEHHPRQLHEMEENDYLAMKRRERAQNGAPPRETR